MFYTPLAFLPPTAIQRLPLQLLRTSQVTRDPRATADAVMAWEGYMRGLPIPTVMPRSVLMQQWKRNPGFANRGGFKTRMQTPASVFAAFQAAKGQPPAGSSASRAVGTPSVALPMAEAAARRGAMRMPQPGALQPTPQVAQRPLEQPLLPPPAAMAKQATLRANKQARAYRCQAGVFEARAAAHRALSLIQTNPRQRMALIGGGG